MTDWRIFKLSYFITLACVKLVQVYTCAFIGNVMVEEVSGIRETSNNI